MVEGDGPMRKVVFIILITILVTITIPGVTAGTHSTQYKIVSNGTLSTINISTTAPWITGALIDDANNPTMPAASYGGIANIEYSIIQDPTNDTIVDNWYRVGDGTHSTTWYATSTNAQVDKWTVYGRLYDIPLDYALPYVIYDSRTKAYYMFVAGTGGIYLYNSTNKINWSALNSGNPVLKPGTTADTYQIFNPGVAIVNESYWPMLIEGKANGGIFTESYAYSNLTELNWTKHLSSASVINPGSGAGAGNPWLGYIPSRSSLLVVTGYSSTSTWKIGTLHANISSDLTQSSSWVHNNGDLIAYSGIHVADPTVCELSGKDPSIVIGFGYNQNEMFQKSEQLSLVDWYDYLGAS